jgi:hypothetical protein
VTGRASSGRSPRPRSCSTPRRGRSARTCSWRRTSASRRPRRGSLRACSRASCVRSDRSSR